MITKMKELLKKIDERIDEYIKEPVVIRNIECSELMWVKEQIGKLGWDECEHIWQEWGTRMDGMTMFYCEMCETYESEERIE